MNIAAFASALVLALEELGTIRMTTEELESGWKVALDEAKRHRFPIQITSVSQLTASAVIEVLEQHKLIEWWKASRCWRFLHIGRENRLRDIRFRSLVRDAQTQELMMSIAGAFVNKLYVQA
jgi:hypothetical protein